MFDVSEVESLINLFDQLGYGDNVTFFIENDTIYCDVALQEMLNLLAKLRVQDINGRRILIRFQRNSGQFMKHLNLSRQPDKGVAIISSEFQGIIFLNMIQKVKSFPGISDRIKSRYRKGM